VKNQRKTISTEEKLDVISQLEKGEWIVEICCNVRFTHDSVCTFHNTDRIVNVLNHELKCSCSKITTVLPEWTVPKTVSYIFIALEIHMLYRTVCILYRNVRGVIKKYGECLNKKNYYSKRHIAINPPHLRHTYPIVLATFWSSSGSPLSWMCSCAVVAASVSWIDSKVYLSWSFWLWGRARSRTVPDPVNKVEENTP
jgi:hypothetical protein